MTAIRTREATGLESMQMKQEIKNKTDRINRRSFVGVGLALAAFSALPRTAAAQDNRSTGATDSKSPEPIGRRKLGRLEVSAVGLGVQNMTRRFEGGARTAWHTHPLGQVLIV